MRCGLWTGRAAPWTILGLAIVSACVSDPGPIEVGDSEQGIARADQGRVAVCHRTGAGAGQSITVSAAAVPAHLDHGDALGECPSGCVSDAACADADACTTDQCRADGTCAHTTVDCDDGNPCTIDGCQPAIGCTTSPASGGACDDGNDCTSADACSSGACVGGPIPGCCRADTDCADGDGCTLDRCVDRACSNAPLACSVPDACVVGFCDPTSGSCASAPLSCDDGDSCTEDTCDPSRGCQHSRSCSAGTIVRLSTGSRDDAQTAPAISGQQVVWSRYAPSNPGDLDVFLFDLTLGTGVNVTQTPDDRELRLDIDAGKIVWVHDSTGTRGDIVLYDTATHLTTTLAASNSTVRYFFPAIRGGRVVWERHVDSVLPGIVDIDLYDWYLGISTPVTNDPAAQGRPRLSDEFVVYEDQSSGDVDVVSYDIPAGVYRLIAGGPGSQSQPDVDGAFVVYVDSSSGQPQVFSYDLATGSRRQLSTGASLKLGPRISGSRVVWADNRNGNLDLYWFDLATNTESALVTGPGNQSQADIDGSRVVYVNDASGFQSIYLFEFAP